MSKQISDKGRTNGKSPSVPAKNPGSTAARQPQQADRPVTPGAKAGTATQRSAQPGTRPAAPGARPAVPQRNNTASGAVKPGMTAQQRVQARQAAARKKKGGFRLRPMDIGLLLAGVIVIALIIFLGISNFSNRNSTAASGGGSILPVGSAAPDFTLPGADGKTYSLSQFKGKPVLLEFFAPWCPHCQEDTSMLNDAYDRYATKGVQFLGVSASPYGRNYEDEQAAGKPLTPITMDDVTWFRDTFHVKETLLFDKDVKQADVYGVKYYPTIYAVDAQGKIASMVAGFYTIDPATGNPQTPSDYTPLSADKINAALDPLVQNQGTPQPAASPTK